MKICFNPNLYPSKNVAHKASMPKPAKIGFSNLDKITSEAEYDALFNKLQQSGNWSKWWKARNKYETALMPYSGDEEIYYKINKVLRGEEITDKRYSNSMLEDIIRLMDYAFNEIDKLYGKFEGIVFRYGRVNEVSKNYVSAAHSPKGLLNFITGVNRDGFAREFNIINVKNGHKIEKIQPFYEEEKEIVISPTKFEKVINPPSQMLQAKEELLKALKNTNIKKDLSIGFFNEV